MNDSALLQAELEASAATLVAGQQPLWPDAGAVRTAVDTLAAYPPLVFAGECDLLRDRMASAARGEAFVLQGGDCAETFAAATADNIRDRIKTILQMAAVLTYGASVPVVKIGRMGGQYAKPRSTGTETRDGLELPAYRGDMVNDFAFEASAQDPRPEPAGAGVPRVVGHPEPRPRVHDGRVRRPAPRARLEQGLRRQRREPEVRQARTRHRHGDEVHGRVRRRLRRDAHRRVLRRARGADPRLRAADDPDRLADRPRLRHVGALRLGRGAHPRPGRCARRLRLAHPEPDRRQGLGQRRARPAAQAARQDRPRPRAGPGHVHHADGRPDDSRRRCLRSSSG